MNRSKFIKSLLLVSAAPKVIAEINTESIQLLTVQKQNLVSVDVYGLANMDIDEIMKIYNQTGNIFYRSK